MELIGMEKRRSLYNFTAKHQDDVEVSDIACDRHGVDTLILFELVNKLPI